MLVSALPGWVCFFFFLPWLQLLDEVERAVSGEIQSLQGLLNSVLILYFYALIHNKKCFYCENSVG